jgi:hypothetical protein
MIRSRELKMVGNVACMKGEEKCMPGFGGETCSKNIAGETKE